jgi:hypothetical protein
MRPKNEEPLQQLQQRWGLVDEVAAGAPIRLRESDCAMLTMACDLGGRYSIWSTCWRCIKATAHA